MVVNNSFTEGVMPKYVTKTIDEKIEHAKKLLEYWLGQERAWQATAEQRLELAKLQKQIIEAKMRITELKQSEKTLMARASTDAMTSSMVL